MIDQNEAIEYPTVVGRKKNMPAVSKSQQRLMQAAEHGANFPKAKKIRKSMTHSQMHDFSVGSEADKPERVGGGMMMGKSKSVLSANVKLGKKAGKSEFEATKDAINKSHPNRHKNLGKFLHSKKNELGEG